MNPAQRLVYLQRMGIAVWQARMPLPGAKPSVVERVVALLDAPCRPVQEIPQKTPAPAPRVEEIAVDVDSGPTENAAAMAFALAFVELPRLLIVADLADAQAPDLSAAETQLLQDIVFALVGRDGLEYMQKSVFNWPLVSGNNIPRHRRAAQEFLHSAIQSKFERSGFTHLLLLGETISDLFTGSAVISTQRRPVVVSACGLVQCMLESQHKRGLWQQIKPLRDALLGT
jgi:DNA polymerase III psi subunit